MILQLTAKIKNSLNGDRMLLPTSALDIILNQYPTMPSPLTFKVSTVSTNFAYGSVREFTAAEGIVEISTQIAFSMGIADKTNVKLELVALEKCRFAALAPLTPNYLAIADIRSLLESHLRQNYTTLFEGKHLVVDFGRNQKVEFKILELHPMPQCQCVDTDMEVDIRTDDLDLAKQALHFKQGTTHTSLTWEGIDGDFDMKISGKIQTEQFLTIPIAQDKSCKYYSLKGTGFVNVFLSDSVERPNSLDHSEFSVELFQHAIDFEVDPQRSFLYLTIVPESMEGEYDFIMYASKNPFNVIDLEGHESMPLFTNQETCPNCNMSVPTRTIQMHLAFCERNNTLCPKCQKVFRKNEFSEHWHCDLCEKSGNVQEKDKHIRFHHTELDCNCGEHLQIRQIADHKKSDCPERFIICRFCHLLVRAGSFSKTAKDLILGMQLTEHESECGARTIPCSKCSRSIQLKDVQTHMKFHEIQKQSQALPFSLCSNGTCGNPISVQYPNAMKLCPDCFKPFWSARNDPNSQKLSQKLVHLYHAQLTAGCTLKNCRNKYCANSLDKSMVSGPMDPTDAAVQAIELLKKSHLFHSIAPQFFLCQSNEILSETLPKVLQLEEVAHEYAREWCAKALIERNGDMTNALKWLQTDAPKK